ncbi:MAG: signal peptidase I [Alphaproteobacteria bacterium]|nr:signal peptidase I [Alphaproteobacteria bacterium]
MRNKVSKKVKSGKKVNADAEKTAEKAQNANQDEQISAARNKAKPKTESFKKSFIENVKTVFIAILLALFIRSLFLEPFRIPSGSMYPTLRVGDYLFVTKYTYGYSRYSFPGGFPIFKGRIWYSEPKRGDVVVFRFSKNGSTDFIKRIIGLPGDTVQVKDGRLYLNGKMVERKENGRYIVDEYVAAPEFYRQYTETLPGGLQHQILEISDEERIVDNTEEMVVPEDSFFVMGDNRDRSDDSRISVGFVDKDYLIGKAKFMFFSHNDKGSLLKPWTWYRAIRWERLFRGIK